MQARDFTSALAWQPYQTTGGRIISLLKPPSCLSGDKTHEPEIYSDSYPVTHNAPNGRLLRSVSKSGKVNGDTLSDWAVWSVVEQSAKQIGIEHFGAHDLRRTCAKLCRKAGGDLEQIKFLLGHSSIQTTERYLGSEQDIAIAVNDSLGL